MSLGEVVQLMLGYAQVYTDQEFVDVPTVPLEERVGIRVSALRSFNDVQSAVNEVEDLARGGELVGPRVREEMGLDEWRQFTVSQHMLIADQQYSNVTVDHTTLFGVRPPELLCVRYQKDYLRWFRHLGRVRRVVVGADGEKVLTSTSEVLLSSNELNSAFVDGLDCQILVRPPAIRELLALGDIVPLSVLVVFETLERICFGGATNADFDTLAGENSSLDWTNWVGCDEMRSVFVDVDYRGRYVPIPLYSSVKPTQAERFLVHVLLSMGKFDTEYDLFETGDIRASFCVAGLVSHGALEDDDVMRGEIDVIVRRYLLEQLLYLPGGTKTFDRLLVRAWEVLAGALLSDGGMPVGDIPAYLYSSLLQVADEKTKAFEMQLRETTCQALRQSVNGCPLVEELVHATKREPLDWVARVFRLLGQSDVSIREQRNGLVVLIKSVNRYSQCSVGAPKGVVIVGGPGSGKTHLMRCVGLYAMAQGLSVVVTAVASERAQELGSYHIHHLFGLKPRHFGGPSRTADLAVIDLHKHPVQLALLRRMDVLCIDELGTVSSELLSTLDIVLRMIRRSTLFMGGVLVFGTLDTEQLQCVHGRPILLSVHMLTSFKMIVLHENVRGRYDLDLQEICRIARKHDHTADELVRFEYLIRTKCRHVASFGDPEVGPNMLRVFGRKRAVQDGERQVLLQMEQNHVVIRYRESEDEECSVGSHGEWHVASAPTSRVLNRNVREVSRLAFFQNELFEMTYNAHGVWSQGQLACLCEVPSQESLDSWEPIALMLAPVGRKVLPEGVISEAVLRHAGWQRVVIRRMVPERNEIIVFGLLGRRIQYGIRPRIAATIHKVMGSDCDGIVSAVVGNPMYKLWDRRQVVVLLSRTKFAHCIIFVGDPFETAQALCELIQKCDQYSQYMDLLIQRMGINCSGSRAEFWPVVDQSVLPWRAIDVELPSTNVGYVYLLLSLGDGHTVYVGQCMNLLKRLTQHQSSVGGALQTRDLRLRPWAVMGYVTGFEQNRQLMVDFEREWRRKRSVMGGDALSPFEVWQMAARIIVDWEERDCILKLVAVQCGTFGR